jgi:uncharacterized protein YodC (DUF2158 family)
VRASEFLLGKFFVFVPTLVFFGSSQVAVKKNGPKMGFFLVWSSHISEIVTVKSRGLEFTGTF